MVLEVFESARRPKCHVTASLRHARRLESARTPKNTPPSARGGETKPDVLRTRSAVFGIGGHFTDLQGGSEILDAFAASRLTVGHRGVLASRRRLPQDQTYIYLALRG